MSLLKTHVLYMTSSNGGGGTYFPRRGIFRAQFSAVGIKYSGCRCHFSPCAFPILKTVWKLLKNEIFEPPCSVGSERTKPVIPALRSLPAWVQSRQEAQVQQRETIPSHLDGNRPVSPVNPWRTSQWNHMQLFQHPPVIWWEAGWKDMSARPLSRTMQTFSAGYGCLCFWDVRCCVNVSLWTFVTFQTKRK